MQPSRKRCLSPFSAARPAAALFRARKRCLSPFFAAAILLLLTSCNLAMRRGNALAAEGKWYAATEAFDEAVAADPNDPEAVAARDEARTEALTQLLVETKQNTDKRRFFEAGQKLSQAFMLSDRWQRPGTGAAELDLLGRAWLDDFATRLNAEGPLKLAPLGSEYSAALGHPRFAELRTALEAAWREAMAARCEGSLANARTPFLRALAVAYCRTAGREAPPPELPLFSMTPRVDDFMRGVSGPWPVMMTQAFDDSPWAWKPSAQHAAMSVSGELDAAYSDVRVWKTATWTVSVPYQTTRWVSVPYTTYQYYSYPCGRTTCTGSRPVTNYRQEPRMHTEYRQEPRSQNYEAIESRVQLSATVKMFVDLRPHAKPLGLVHELVTTETGLTHSGVPAANLPASQARLPTRAEWDAKQRQAARAKLKKALVEHWRDSYCNPPLADAEAAARCAFGGSVRPEEQAYLDSFFRDDVGALVSKSRFGL